MTTKTLSAAVAAAMICATGPALAMHHEQVTLASANDIIGMDIETNDGREAGEIEYLLVDTTSGKVRYALIEEDDELELEDDQLVALPFSALNLENADSDEIEADVSLAQLTGAMKVDEDALDEFLKPAMVTQVYNYFRIPEEDRIADAPEGEEAGEAEGYDGLPHMLVTRTAVTTLVPGLSRADRIIGSEVRMSNGKEMGEIEEIVLNASDGTVAYVLVGQGGFLGIGEEYSAVPLQVLTWDIDEEAYSVSKDPDKRFRKLSKSNLPATVNKSQLDDFYQAYELKESQ